MKAHCYTKTVWAVWFEMQSWFVPFHLDCLWLLWLEMVCWCLFQVIQWCTHHKDDPPPPEDDENKEKRTDDIPVWDQEFLKVDQGTLFELILVNLVLQCIMFILHWLTFIPWALWLNLSTTATSQTPSITFSLKT